MEWQDKAILAWFGFWGVLSLVVLISAVVAIVLPAFVGES